MSLPTVDSTGLEAKKAQLARSIRSLTEEVIVDPTFPEIHSAYDINRGFCAQFLEWLGGANPPAFDWTGDVGTSTNPYVVCSILHRFDNVGVEVKPPPDLSLAEILSCEANLALDHAWLHFAGRHYDAEAPDGVSEVFELPCLRRALVEGLRAMKPGLLEDLVGRSAWWGESLRLERTFASRPQIPSAAAEADFDDDVLVFG